MSIIEVINKPYSWRLFHLQQTSFLCLPEHYLSPRLKKVTNTISSPTTQLYAF